MKSKKGLLDQNLSPAKGCRPKGQTFRPNLGLALVVSKIGSMLGGLAEVVDTSPQEMDPYVTKESAI